VTHDKQRRSVTKQPLLILASTLLSSSLWGSIQCLPHEATVIDSEARCIEGGGINIGYNGDDGMKVACMESKQVQGLCGPDGQLTRLRAYAQWFTKLKHFQDTCSTEGGTFSFQDKNFVEPPNENYCLQAVPEVGSNMFEEPLCNYRSVCPAVTVTCERPCAEPSVASLY
jgi:hypothetical protein